MRIALLVTSLIASHIWQHVMAGDHAASFLRPTETELLAAHRMITTLPPLIAALLLIGMLEKPMGSVAVVAETRPWPIRILTAAIFAAILCAGVAHLDQKLDAPITVMTLRNAFGFLGFACLLLRFMRPTRIWMIMLPGWFALFLSPLARSPDSMPQALVFWPFIWEVPVGIQLLILGLTLYACSFFTRKEYYGP